MEAHTTPPTATPVFELSPEGRRITWGQWKQAGGCGLAHASYSAVAAAIGHESTWTDIELGRFADVCPAAGRGLARYAATRLGKGSWAQPYGTDERAAVSDREADAGVPASSAGPLPTADDHVASLQNRLRHIETTELETLRARGIRQGPESEAIERRAVEIRKQLFELTGDWYGRPKQPKEPRPSGDELDAAYESPDCVPAHVLRWVRRHCSLLNSDATDAVRWSRIIDTRDDERYPEGEIVVYRAVADGDDIRPGDWVTLEREYAEEHLRRWLNNRGRILTECVDGRDVLVSPTGNPEEAIYAPRELSGPHLEDDVHVSQGRRPGPR
jgi:hypothetical protein